jgi:hypothetical protein
LAINPEWPRVALSAVVVASFLPKRPLRLSCTRRRNCAAASNTISREGGPWTRGHENSTLLSCIRPSRRRSRRRRRGGPRLRRQETFAPAAPNRRLNKHLARGSEKASPPGGNSEGRFRRPISQVDFAGRFRRPIPQVPRNLVDNDI